MMQRIAELRAAIVKNASPEQKSLMVKSLVMGIVILGALGLYSASDQPHEEVTTSEPLRSIALGDELLEDDLRAEFYRDQQAQKEHNETVYERMVHLEGNLTALSNVLGKIDARLEEPPIPPSFPPVVETAQPTVSAPMEVVMIGGIGHSEGTLAPAKKKEAGFYLSPGFMEAMLLTGLKAETIEDARENPEPMLIRVQKPAVLPNHIKANLQGCFVVAHGFGKLSSERIDARLVSLHCTAPNGVAVIDERIKGFVVDKDGSKGLAGVPVSKMGANMARVFLAGVFGGIGEGVQAQNSTIATSPLGTTQSFDGQQVMQSGLGRGITDAAADIRRVYLDLVRQSAPVIEVGPTKAVTVVITEGVDLKIRDRSTEDV